MRDRKWINSLTIILRAFPAKHRLMPFLQKGKNRDERQHTTVFAFRPHHHFCYPIQLSSVYTVFHVLSFLLMSLALFPTSGHARQSLPENESGFLKPEKRPVGATMIENYFTTISHEVTVFYISSLWQTASYDYKCTLPNSMPLGLPLLPALQLRVCYFRLEHIL